MVLPTKPEKSGLASGGGGVRCMCECCSRGGDYQLKGMHRGPDASRI